jgi:hypothetical protein
MRGFRDVLFRYVPRDRNEEADNCAQNALGYRLDDMSVTIEIAGSETKDWRKDILQYLRD